MCLRTGHGMRLLSDNRSEPSPASAGASPAPAFGGAVVLFGTFGAVTHTLHPLPLGRFPGPVVMLPGWTAR